MPFENVYSDPHRADSYARLEFPGTYYLAFRDIPAICAAHVTGRRALDFGCGAGRSTRFLRKLGYDTTGVDISESMLAQARRLDPGGDFRLIPPGDLGLFDDSSFDLILSMFTFDNVGHAEDKLRNFREFARILRPTGCLVSVVSSPEIYKHEWASFSTKDFPENQAAKNGDIVRTRMLDVPDQRPVDDILCDDELYRSLYAQSSLNLVQTYSPLALDSEPFAWVNETRLPPWTIYVLKKK